MMNANGPETDWIVEPLSSFYPYTDQGDADPRSPQK